MREQVNPLITRAIAEAVRAGVFRRAERLNKRSAQVWGDLAQPHTEAAREMLGAFLASTDGGRT